VTQLEGDGCKASRLLVGSFMTSFDMQGASVSILPLKGDITSKDIVSLIDAVTDAPAWAKVDVWSDLSQRPSENEVPEVAGESSAGNDTGSTSLPPVLVENFSTLATAIISRCCNALIETEPTLTKYDTIVGDGDCGITMARGAKEISQRLESKILRIDHPSLLFSDLADAVSASMGGTSGILLELMFRKASTTLMQSTGEGITSKELAKAFRAGAEAVSFYGGAQEGSRTMLDALYPASATMVEVGSVVDIKGAAEAARKGADATAAMDHAEAGRSNYLSKEVLMGTPDPGAVAVAVILEAFSKVVA